VALCLNDGVLVEKDNHGETRMTPRNDDDRLSRGIVRLGCGCEMCERSESARFPPAESPAKMIVDGSRFRVPVTCLMSKAACCS